MNAQDWAKSVIRGVMCLSGITGNNWLLFRSLPRSRSQLKTNDVLFANLALSNLITNYMVDLPDTLDFTSRFAGRQYCGAFNFCSDLSETSSIFTTMFITLFWYQKLVGSSKRGGARVQMDNLRLVAALLSGSWTVAVVFSVPHFFFVSRSNWNMSTTDCMEDFHSHESRQSYEFLYLALANFVPILGIVFGSIQITVTLLQSQRRVNTNTRLFSKGGKNTGGSRNASDGTSGCPQDTPEEAIESITVAPVRRSQARSGSTSGTLVRAAKSVVAVAVVFLMCWITHLILSIISTFRESSLVVDLASYIGAAYTCIIPYIYLHGVKKLNCSSRG